MSTYTKTDPSWLRENSLITPRAVLEAAQDRLRFELVNPTHGQDLADAQRAVIRAEAKMQAALVAHLCAGVTETQTEIES